MTRKTALKEAINIVKSSEVDTKMKENVIEKLELCISELPFAQWSEAAIFDACDQFIEDHGRPLILNDFQSKELPSHPTVKNRFKMTLKEFRDTYYPLLKKYTHKRIVVVCVFLLRTIRYCVKIKLNTYLGCLCVNFNDGS